MAAWEWLGMLIGAVVPWQRASSSPPIGVPPVDYQVLTQDELLASFSDSVGPNGITPRSMRNLVGSSPIAGSVRSSPLLLPGWTTANRPPASQMSGPAVGYNYDLRQMDFWDDQLQAWINPAFVGGTVAGETTFVGAVTFGGAVNLGAAVEVGSLPVVKSETTGQLWKNGSIVSVS